jgi:hypothetical protein
VHSYINLDRTKTFCVYDAPTLEAIRQVGQRNHLPVGGITEVSVIDPYLYLGIGHAGHRFVGTNHLRTPWLPFSYIA